MSSIVNVRLPLRLIFLHLCILLYVVPWPSNGLKHSTCEKINACQCTFPGGLGVDLSKLKIRANDIPWISGNTTDNNSTFYFHPCSNFIFPGDNNCSDGFAVCLFNKTIGLWKNQHTLLGKTEEATFESASLKDPIYLKYVHENITTTILLQCAQVNATTLTPDPVTTPNQFKLTLKSPLVCAENIASDVIDHSLSTGSVLVILFCTFSLVYLVGGALVLKFTRGAAGKELIPNYDFWAALPSLVRDGALFLLSGCQPAATYDRI